MREWAGPEVATAWEAGGVRIIFPFYACEGFGSSLGSLTGVASSHGRVSSYKLAGGGFREFQPYMVCVETVMAAMEL